MGYMLAGAGIMLVGIVVGAAIAITKEQRK